MDSSDREKMTISDTINNILFPHVDLKSIMLNQSSENEILFKLKLAELLDSKEQTNDSSILSDSHTNDELVQMIEKQYTIPELENLLSQINLINSDLNKLLEHRPIVPESSCTEDNAKILLNEIIEKASTDTKTPLKIYLRRMLDVTFGEHTVLKDNSLSIIQEDNNSNIKHNQNNVDEYMIIKGVNEIELEIKKNSISIPCIQITPATPK